jgi:hypothetical protein
VIGYDDGEVRQQFSICFAGRLVGGELRTSSESKEAEWISPDALAELDMHPSMRLRIQHALQHRETPFIGFVTRWYRRDRHRLRLQSSSEIEYRSLGAGSRPIGAL